MLKFTMSLNENFPKEVGDEPPAGERRVTCWTCHRGDKEPQTRRPEQPGGPGAPGGSGCARRPATAGAPPQGQPPRPPAV